MTEDRMLPKEAVPKSASRATIVIAEDDLTTRLVLRQVLTRERFRVVAVENGRLACEAVRREHPDVVLLDWLMPEMDGRAALEELKSNAETRGIPIVMLTSHSQVAERIIALEAGVQDFLSKPFDPRELVACIEQQLRWRDRLASDADTAFLAERDALRAASERRYRLLAEAMSSIVWITDARGAVAYFNRAWFAYTGAEGEPAGSTAWDVAAHPDDRASSLEAWSLSLETGRPFEMQFRLRRGSDGMYRWHVARAIPNRDENGEIVEWVGSFTDIHDYKIATKTREILDTIGNVVSIRTDGGFVDYAGPYWNEYTGADVGAALGFGWRDFVHADDLATVDRARNDIHTFDVKAPDFEMRIRRHDGKYRWFLSQTKQLPNAPDAPRRWLDTATDIDDLKRAQSALASSETRYRALTDSMPQMVWVTDAAATIEYVNARWSDYTGLDLAATRTAGICTVVDDADVAAIDALHSAPANAEYTAEARFRRFDGVFRWHAIRAVPFDDNAGGPRKWIGTATDIEDSKAAAAILADTAAELEHLAHHDPMTNLPNRMLLVERLSQAIALAQRAKSELLVLYVDLDRFKIINDTRGHAAGDRVLAVTGGRIAEALRAGDTASRVGGDEFVLVCATTEAAEDAARLANRLIEAIGQPIEIDGEFVTIGASIGISMYPADGVDGNELIQNADSAMYSAKQSGRNLFRIYRAETHSSIVAALDLETELGTAIAHGQIVVHYQPILSLRTNKLLGAEALVRWQHPTRGLLHPIDFLAFAEARRLIGEIGTIVLEAVCAQIAALDTTVVSDDFHVSMNVSAHQIMQPGWVSEIARMLTKHGADPRRLQIEIAESVVVNETAAVLSILDELRALGISLSINDFGTGLSSLSSIKTFPLHTLKIDRSFVADIATNISDQAVAKTIIMLAHSLGLNVVAAGVETPAQIDALREYGSDAFQGYLASRPMASAEFAAFLRGRALNA
jgi:diguanylate cyclase (GGDEF)-like protein/PAS domain S-box-containing protein